MICIATWAYVGLVALTVWYIYKQLEEQKKERKFQIVLTIFRELKTQEFIDTRRYIYDNLPEDIEDIESSHLKTHFQKAETALTAFDRVGYLLDKGHIDAGPIMENYWASVWRCWKKSKNLINWAREQRGQKDYFYNFEYLFDLAEVYRVQNGYEEPKFY